VRPKRALAESLHLTHSFYGILGKDFAPESRSTSAVFSGKLRLWRQQ
jgi:hypothetical protein